MWKSLQREIQNVSTFFVTESRLGWEVPDNTWIYQKCLQTQQRWIDCGKNLLILIIDFPKTFFPLIINSSWFSHQDSAPQQNPHPNPVPNPDTQTTWFLPWSCFSSWFLFKNKFWSIMNPNSKTTCCRPGTRWPTCTTASNTSVASRMRSFSKNSSDDYQVYSLSQPAIFM